MSQYKSKNVETQFKPQTYMGICYLIRFGLLYFFCCDGQLEMLYEPGPGVNYIFTDFARDFKVMFLANEAWGSWTEY